HGQGSMEKNRVNLTGSKARKQKEQEKRENRDAGSDKGHDTANIQIGSLVAHGGPSLAASTRTGALSLRTVARLQSLSEWSIGMRLHGFRPRSLAASQNLPVDELPEGRVDPCLHLGFLPVLPEPPGPEGVLRPL